MTGLDATLATLARAMSACRDPWAVYGGAGLYLHGIYDGALADIDVLVSDRDALALLARPDVQPKHVPPSDMFRSRHFLKAGLGPVPVEIMAGLEVCRDGDWLAVEAHDVQTVTVGGAPVRVAARPDLIRLFRLLGREKDLRRASLLETSD